MNYQYGYNPHGIYSQTKLDEGKKMYDILTSVKHCSIFKVWDSKSKQEHEPLTCPISHPTANTFELHQLYDAMVAKFPKEKFIELLHYKETYVSDIFVCMDMYVANANAKRFDLIQNRKHCCETNAQKIIKEMFIQCLVCNETHFTYEDTSIFCKYVKEKDYYSIHQMCKELDVEEDRVHTITNMACADLFKQEEKKDNIYVPDFMIYEMFKDVKNKAKANQDPKYEFFHKYDLYLNSPIMNYHVFIPVEGYVYFDIRPICRPCRLKNHIESTGDEIIHHVMKRRGSKNIN